jgi:hypothetical protein
LQALYRIVEVGIAAQEVLSSRRQDEEDYSGNPQKAVVRFEPCEGARGYGSRGSGQTAGPVLIGRAPPQENGSETKVRFWVIVR